LPPFHAGFSAVVALMTDPVHGEPCGVHRTLLNADATKKEKRMLGKAGVVRVSPHEAVTHGLGITEGIEDALAVLISGWSPVWAATSAGAIKTFPVLPGIEALTIFQDDNAAGTDSAETCANRWHDAGREVFLASLKEEL
jgi:putative DNA primase/helicase